MARYAILNDGVAVNVVEASADYAEAKGWVLAEHANIGDTWDGNAWHMAGETLDALKAKLLEAATARRWEVETGGITLTGMRVGTTKADQDRITSVVANAALAGVTVVDFKAASGWISLNIDQVRDVAAAIALHVQACFSAERSHHETIGALETVEAAQAYDVSTGWPGGAHGGE